MQLQQLQNDNLIWSDQIQNSRYNKISRTLTYIFWHVNKVETKKGGGG